MCREACGVTSLFTRNLKRSDRTEKSLRSKNVQLFAVLLQLFSSLRVLKSIYNPFIYQLTFETAVLITAIFHTSRIF